MFSNLGSIYNYGISMGLITSVSAMLHFLDDFTFADGTCILNFMYIIFKSTPNTIFSVNFKRQLFIIFFFYRVQRKQPSLYYHVKNDE